MISLDTDCVSSCRRHASCASFPKVQMMRKANLRNLLQIVALSAPPVLMALAGLLLRRSPKHGGFAEKTKPTQHKRS